MKKYLTIILLSLSLTVQASDIKLLQPTLFERITEKVQLCTWHITCYFKPTLGSTITTIQGTDTVSASRPVINTNFANLNSDKLESGNTAASLTINTLTANNLTTDRFVATSTASSTVKNLNIYGGLAIGRTSTTTIRGDTATSTFSNGISLLSGCFLALDGTCLANSSGGITSLNGLSGATQTFTTSNGLLSIESSGTTHNFNGSSSPTFFTVNATSTTATSTISKIKLTQSGTGIEFSDGTIQVTKAVTAASGITSIQSNATTTSPGFIGNMVITHNLGRTPIFFEIIAIGGCNGSGNTVLSCQSQGTATTTTNAYYITNSWNCPAQLCDFENQAGFGNGTTTIVNLRNTSSDQQMVGNLTAMDDTTFTINVTRNDTGGVHGQRRILWKIY